MVLSSNSMGENVVLSGMEMMKNRGKSSEVVQWEKYLPNTVFRVLLVESDDSTRQIITALLRKCSYKVVDVSDGLAAWEILKEKSNDFDLILTELDLPSISGFSLLALVMEHQTCKNIPVIMMSSQDSIKMVMKCMLKGAADYLIKPMRKNELKILWQHVWRRLTLRNDEPTVHAQSLPASQHNGEDNDEESKYHSDQGCGRVDVTMDLIGGIDKWNESVCKDNSCDDEYIGPELGLSLKRASWSVDDQKCSLSNCDKPEEKNIVALEMNNSGEPKTPTESHEKLRNDRKEVEVGSQSTSDTNEEITGQSIRPKEEESVNVQQSWCRSQREAALLKFRLKRKDRCFDKKVRYQSRKKLAEERPRVKGQFVRAVNSDASTKS